MCLEQINIKLAEIDVDLVFWDTKDLIRVTRLSWPTIQNTFFYDPRFPKRRQGTKWLFPAKDARAFLIKWLMEQPKT
nr:group-specific protein [Paenibacillus sp. ACRRX]